MLGWDDYINTKAGNDIINAGEGNDIIDGGEGDDILLQKEVMELIQFMIYQGQIE
jgi:Ca2+-binding RTX toxin-like protein